jgi:hypothetical protein
MLRPPVTGHVASPVAAASRWAPTAVTTILELWDRQPGTGGASRFMLPASCSASHADTGTVVRALHTSACCKALQQPTTVLTSCLDSFCAWSTPGWAPGKLSTC